MLQRYCKNIAEIFQKYCKNMTKILCTYCANTEGFYNHPFLTNIFGSGAYRGPHQKSLIYRPYIIGVIFKVAKI